MQRSSIYALCALLLLTGASRATAQDAKAVVSSATTAMGAEKLKTLVLIGSGSATGVGQNTNPVNPWPLTQIKTYTRSIDFDTAASSFETVRIQNKVENPQNQVTPANAPWALQFDVWVTTPFAFLKGAATNAVTLRSETVNQVKYNVVSFTLQNKYKVEGYISDKNIVERTRTWIDNDVLGDMMVEGIYSDFKDFAGVKIPTLTIVKQGGFPTLIAGVTEARVNTPVAIPAAPAQAAAAAVAVDAEKIADGVYYLKGGTHHSVLVEFADHVTLVEAPQNEARSLALIAKAKELYPGKPLTQVVNTHHHFDHAGGLRTFVDAGATILTHESNKTFLEMAFKAPRTLNPDRLEKSKKAAVIKEVGDKLVLSDATRTMELHLVKNNQHADGMLVAFLPKEKVLVEVDMFTPGSANTEVSPSAIALVDNMEKLRLDFETILPLHGPGKATRADLYTFTKKNLVPVSSLPDPNAAPAGGRGGGRGGGGGGRGGNAGGAGQAAPPLPATPTP